MGKNKIKVKRFPSSKRREAADFLPLEGGPGKNLPKDDGEPPVLNSSVLYVGRIPHGFYEEQMQAFFKQFGAIKRLRVALNRKFTSFLHRRGSPDSRHYGFIEFESPEVAKIVADCMHNYLLFEHMLQVHLVPPGKAHPAIWRHANRKYDPSKGRRIESTRCSKVKTAEGHKKMLEGILKRDLKRRKKIKAAGIDYEYPDIAGDLQPIPKKIKFTDE